MTGAVAGDAHLRVFRQKRSALGFLREAIILVCQSAPLEHTRDAPWRAHVGSALDVLECAVDSEERRRRRTRIRVRGQQWLEYFHVYMDTPDRLVAEVATLIHFALVQAVDSGREYDVAWRFVARVVDHLEVSRKPYEDAYARWRYRDLVPRRARSADGERDFCTAARASLEFACTQFVKLID